ncbi:MAG: M28 family peptidase [Bacteroidota bacterium]
MFPRTIGLILVIFAAYWSITSLQPSYKSNSLGDSTDFSVDRALEHVRNISRTPHAVGFPGHATTRAYIISQLKKMGLETAVQEGYTAGDSGNFSKAINILARIKGSGNGKALLLLSHYDSSPHSSYGASDAGSGVATVLEGVRTFLAEKKTPKNDVIILISDAEELGLNGADLFVNQHPWAKEIGLVLNFEARGSGGPSYMLMETNRGNSNLIKEFAEAGTAYPLGNSLAYSIYKMLPNDTDLTVFREDRDIEGFVFAFIDDFYDYHSALDTYDRMDRNSLAHQGSYIMPLLAHFSEFDLNSIKSLNDDIYFNMPFFQLITYPFEWIWPMFILTTLIFLILLVYGFKKKALTLKNVITGVLPALIVLVVNALIGFCSWPILKWWYPWYTDILQGFPYNGHLYIFSFVLLALGICFFTYRRFRNLGVANLLVSPIFLWLVLCYLTGIYVKGASFFIIPVLGLLVALLVFINQEKPNPLLLVFLCLPAIFIHVPFIQMLPVGLGLKMMIAATLLTTLLFFLVYPFFGLLKNSLRIALLCLFLFMVFSIRSHLQSGFSPEHPKPSSLLYLYNADTDQSRWASYDNVLIGWNSQFLKESEKISDKEGAFETLASKYNTGFTFTQAAPKKNIPPPDISVTRDTIIGDSRLLTVCVTPQRLVNRLDIFTNTAKLNKVVINNVTLSDYYLQQRTRSKLLTHFISNNDFTELELEIPKEENLKLSFYEASNNLLSHAMFSVPDRPKNSIPMPFVLNDAIVVIKSLEFD